MSTNEWHHRNVGLYDIAGQPAKLLTDKNTPADLIYDLWTLTVVIERDPKMSDPGYRTWVVEKCLEKLKRLGNHCCRDGQRVLLREFRTEIERVRLGGDPDGAALNRLTDGTVEAFQLNVPIWIPSWLAENATGIYHQVYLRAA